LAWPSECRQEQRHQRDNREHDEAGDAPAAADSLVVSTAIPGSR